MGNNCLKIMERHSSMRTIKYTENRVNVEKIYKIKNDKEKKDADNKSETKASDGITNEEISIKIDTCDCSLIVIEKVVKKEEIKKEKNFEYKGVDNYFTKKQYLEFTGLYGKDIGKKYRLEKEVKSKELDYIAKGSFGIVIKSYDENNKIYIVTKKVNIKNKSKPEIKKIKREVKILKNFRHRNIISCFGFSETKKFLNIFFEYAGLKSIDIMLKEYGPFKKSVIKNYTKQILHGLGYLHYQGIIHRDIKGGNILVTCKGVVKLSDFGCSKDLGSNLISFVGSFGWMSPEMYRGDKYGRQTDIWSLGCTVYEMYTGKSPFYKQRKKILEFKDDDLVFPDFIDDEGVSFIKACIRQNQNDRLNVYELLQHSYVRHVDVYNSAFFQTGRIELKTYETSKKNNLEKSENNISFEKKKKKIY